MYRVSGKRECRVGVVVEVRGKFTVVVGLGGGKEVIYTKDIVYRVRCEVSTDYPASHPALNPVQ